MEESRLSEISNRISNPKARENWLKFMKLVENSDDVVLDSECEEPVSQTLAADLQEMERIEADRLKRIENLSAHNPFPFEVQLEIPVGINAQDCGGGMTRLMAATMDGDIEQVRELLELGADKTIKDNAGLTVRDMAVRLEMTEILALLDGISVAK